MRHPSVIVGVLALAALYALSAALQRRRFGRGQAAALSAALIMLLFALDGPIDRWEDARSFVAHMVQHLMLGLLMPPLLLLGTPGWMLEPVMRRRWPASIARIVFNPLVAFSAYAVFMMTVHMPHIYERMCRDEDFHIAMHLIMIVTGVMLWMPLLSPSARLPRLSYPAQTLYLFFLPVPMAAVAAPITLAEHVIYPWYLEGPHPFGLTPLADQVLGGLCMWVGTGFFFICVFTLIFFRWARRDGIDQPPVPDSANRDWSPAKVRSIM